MELKSFIIINIWLLIYLGHHHAACSTLTMKCDFLLAKKNSVCVVSEEYLDTAFSYLREVLVSVQRNHQSNMFMINYFVKFLGRFLCYFICPAGYRMAVAPLELEWQQQCLSPPPPPRSRSKFLCWAAP